MTVAGFFGASCAPAIAAEASTITIVARSWDRMGCLSANSDADRWPRNTSAAGPAQFARDSVPRGKPEIGPTSPDDRIDPKRSSEPKRLSQTRLTVFQEQVSKFSVCLCRCHAVSGQAGALDGLLHHARGLGLFDKLTAVG